MEPQDEVFDILGLPDELLLCILFTDVISVRDVCRVAQTCTRFRNVTETSKLWRNKLQRQWRKVWAYLPADIDITDWRDEVKQVVCFDMEVRKMVSGLSHRIYKKSRLTTPVYNEVDAMVFSTPYASFYMKDSLRKIINDGEEHKNLTDKYYALKVLRHVHQGICQKEWEEFLALPPSQQCLEVGTIMLAQWFQPNTDVGIKEIASEFDKLAEMCRTRLHVLEPDHPAILSPLVPFDEILPDSKWNRERCEQVMNAINDVMYSQLNFSGKKGTYYCLENSLINEVLRAQKGIPITLSIVYMCVGHRLGLRIEPVNFPSHFLVRWKVPGTSKYKYIDAFEKGRRFSLMEMMTDVPFIDNPQEILISCETMEVFQRMIRNIMNVAQMKANISDHMDLYCPATELMSVLTPTDQSVQELLLRMYYTLEIHYDRIAAGCQQFLEHNPSIIMEEILGDCQQILKSESELPKPITPNLRSGRVNYATGVVMQHRRYNYSCVIYGWDKECKMPEDWVRRMGVDKLHHKTKQPFYNVLVHDGSNRYAAQENLSVSEDPMPISHPDIGRYFQKFAGSHYIPNPELKQQYPEDEEARITILSVRGFLMEKR